MSNMHNYVWSFIAMQKKIDWNTGSDDSRWHQPVGEGRAIQSCATQSLNIKENVEHQIILFHGVNYGSGKEQTHIPFHLYT